MKMTIIRNLLLVIGIYCLSMWVLGPIAAIYQKIILSIRYGSDMGMFLSSVIPTTLVALGAGILCVYTLEGQSRKYWLLLLALLFGVFGFLGWHWVQPPRVIDRVGQLVCSLMPTIACFLAGYITLNSSQSKQK